MGCPGVGPCDSWPLLLCCVDSSGGFPDACSVGGVFVDQTTIDEASQAASQVMWALTGRQFGLCTVVTRPCRKACFDGGFSSITLPWNGGRPFPVLINGEWFNVTCGCGTDCSCTELCEVALPYPVCSVSQVLVDGVALPSSAYRIDDFRKLVRVDGECWPKCQNMSLPTTEEGTWSVALTYGREVPQLVLTATAELACEILKSCVGQPCKLPQRVQNITRQGVSLSLFDPQDFLDGGRTGFYLADLAIKTFNPRGLARRPGVYSPDMNQWRVPTG